MSGVVIAVASVSLYILSCARTWQNLKRADREAEVNNPHPAP
jgi:hypothetical protein